MRYCLGMRSAIIRKNGARSGLNKWNEINRELAAPVRRPSVEGLPTQPLNEWTLAAVKAKRFLDSGGKNPEVYGLYWKSRTRKLTLAQVRRILFLLRDHG